MNKIKRNKPNILITGTPGTGKSSLAEQIANSHQFNHFDISQLVKEKGLDDGFDEEFQCLIIDEDKVCDELEEPMCKGGCVVDHHSSEWFPERWFDLVIVLQTDIQVLYKRLEKRGYIEKKITNNIDCEIMQTMLDEALGAYKEEIVITLPSNNVEDSESNQAKISNWIEQWQNINSLHSDI
ncbi:hypothetical protein DLAC_09293 [Tieghemostelium lacteum]|uniref:Adenylate kinase isoenzyme 6 homolog n=1 Tax=Tieghemostelium lacteum TaxID=361077 RepID=A0A151Z9P7_TIELA|nr:hypothetical protein DLAC_09293 [Tieghemostelium lacteum]|eukprot:KYQ90659.1 hypothetical protein DLAC_09293 [Tieghemostelium lacteum]